MSAPTVARHRKPVFHSLPVAAVDRITDDAVTVTFDVPPELREDYTFTAGQHVTVRCDLAGDTVRRNYSLCSSATSGVLRVAVKRLAGGTFSAYVHERLRPGDEMEVMTPTGHFSPPLDPANAKHYVAVAAGSGITPVLSILTTVLELEPHSRCTLIYGNRTTSSIMFLEELQDLKNAYPERFHLVHVLSREQQDVDLFHGRIDGERTSRLLDTLLSVDDVDEWFLCGPFTMVESVRETLIDAGADPDHVHREFFHVESTPPRRTPAADGDGAATVSAGTSAVRIVLDGRATTFELSPDGSSILDAALAVRNDAPYACKGGVCGTCRAMVVEGEVEMDQNYALERDEIEKGFVLACQSHPKTAQVILDFDQ
jgi:ring-1,2-phenylacetyl-CoA epoxidase subunit PaaE